MLEVIFTNITRVSVIILEPNDMRSRSVKISFYVSLSNQVICEEDSNYQSNSNQILSLKSESCCTEETVPGLGDFQYNQAQQKCYKQLNHF